MKIPKTPPKMQDLLLQSLSGSKWANALANPTPTVGGRYLHWDRLRYHEDEKPESLSLEDWWLRLKLSRSILSKPIPLRDRSGKPFQFGLVDPLPQSLHEIDLRAGGTIQMPEPITNPHTKHEYLVRSLIEEAFTSSQLEGAATTRERAKEMIRKDRQPRDRGERMVLNNYDTMDHILTLSDQRLTPEIIRDIQRRITLETLDDPATAGRFRRPHEQIVVGDATGEIVYHDPPPAEELDDRVARLCAFANGETPDFFVHPAIRSMILHFWLAYDHPFVDGNGRTARALFYWSMLRHGYWLFEYVSISQFLLKAPMKYQRAFLETETDDNDLTYFLLYHAEVIRRAIDELHAYINRKTRQVRDGENRLRHVSDLNLRQRATIADALRHPDDPHTVESYRRAFGVVTQTARTDLDTLVDRGFFLKHREGRAFVYRPTPDLDARLDRDRLPGDNQRSPITGDSP